MTTKEIFIKNNVSFIYDGIAYDIKQAIKDDTETIIANAIYTHSTEFDSLYKRDSLRPEKVRLFLNELGRIMYIMIIYYIDYKDNHSSRSACGMYHPISDNQQYVDSHPYQGSICW